MNNIIKYRVIPDGDDSIAVVLEDGGYAEVHSAEPLDAESKRQATTGYYQTKFTQSDILSDEPIYELLGEGKMYYNDWDTEFTDPAHIQNILEWLAPEHTYELDETIWPDLIL